MDRHAGFPAGDRAAILIGTTCCDKLLRSLFTIVGADPQLPTPSDQRQVRGYGVMQR